jgi:hypothetical protein
MYRERYVEVLNAAGTRWTTEEDNKLYAMGEFVIRWLPTHPQ